MSTAGSRPRVFGIGLNKTGTTTLAHCGRILGLRCSSCDKAMLEDVVYRNDLSRLITRVRDYDLFEDWPYPLVYRQLDQAFPGSKFILTVRSSAERWLESLRKHALRTHPTRHCRKLAYGFNYPHRHVAEHLAFYRSHNDRARSYFAGRENDFLELCWENGDGFEKLCGFLGHGVPDVPLPHANKGDQQRVSRGRYFTNRILSTFW